MKRGKIEKCLIDYGYVYEVRIFELIGAVEEYLEELRRKYKKIRQVLDKIKMMDGNWHCYQSKMFEGLGKWKFLEKNWCMVIFEFGYSKLCSEKWIEINRP